MNRFTLMPANDFIWNQTDFLQFLIDNQGTKITINTNGEGVCLTSSGVYKLLNQFNYTDVTINTANLLESHPQFRIQHQAAFKFFKIQHSNYEHLHKWNQKKIFGCFYNRPIWYRIGLSSVLQHDYNSSSIINIRASAINEDSRKLFEIQQLFNAHPASFIKFSKVFDLWPNQLEFHDGYAPSNTTGHTDQLAEFYLDLLIDVVAETWATGTSFFVTEKTIRPMLLQKPMIVMGPKNYLAHLRQLGFRTFSDFWDESYDAFEGKDRYVKILNLIDTLSKKSKQELYEMYWNMKYSLEHNYNLLKTQSYGTGIIKL